VKQISPYTEYIPVKVASGTDRPVGEPCYLLQRQPASVKTYFRYPCTSASCIECKYLFFKTHVTSPSISPASACFSAYDYLHVRIALLQLLLQFGRRPSVSYEYVAYLESSKLYRPGFPELRVVHQEIYLLRQAYY